MTHLRTKTVLILDHGTYFSQPSGIPFNVHLQTNDHQQQTIQTNDEINNENQFQMKSLWTCVVECILEYCRILFDIFEDETLITLIVTGIDQRDKSSYWNRYLNLTQCMEFLAGIQPPTEYSSANENDLLKYSLNEAITALCTRSKRQQIPSDQDLLNHGNIILFSTLNNERLTSIENDIHLFHESRNHMALEINDFVPLTQCHLTLIDVRPLNQSIPTIESQSKSITSILHRTLYYSQAGQMLFTRLLKILLKQHNLALTTVTGIPMKEDVSSRSSLNYDVDIVHPAEVHQILNERAPLKYWRQIKDDVQTIVLKWSSLSYDSENYYDTYSAYRFSPLDVNSRESTCLTNFLLNGKCVLLELGSLPNESTININQYIDEKYRNRSEIDSNLNLSSSSTTNRLFSHMIISHNQQLMIHSIAFGINNPMNKIASNYIISDQQENSLNSDLEEIFDEIDDEILEKDLRVDSFINLIRTTTLYPMESMTSGKIPIEDSLRLLERHTRRCPLLTNETILFHLSTPISLFIHLILREKLTNDDVGKCLMVLQHIETMEQNGEVLPLPNNFLPTIKMSTAKMKKEESYRFLWREIEYFVRGYKETSDDHRLLYQTILDRRRIDFDNELSIYQSNKIEFIFPTDEDSSIKLSDINKEKTDNQDDFQNRNARVWSEFNDIKQVINANSLQDMWNRKQQEKRATEFDGRMECPPPRKIQLYNNTNNFISTNILSTTNGTAIGIHSLASLGTINSTTMT